MRSQTLIYLIFFSFSVFGISGCATTNKRWLTRERSTARTLESSSARKTSRKPPVIKHFTAKAGELSFVGEAYHENPGKAREKAKSEAFEKMIASLIGIDINAESIDKITYSKDFSDSTTFQEKGRIDFRRTLAITSGELKGLRVRVESSCSKDGDLFHAVAYVFIGKKEAEKARMRRELEQVLLETKVGRRTSVNLPQNPETCLEEAITILAKKFASVIGKHEDIKRIAVLDIAGDNSNSLREEIINSLFKTQEYELVERRAALLEQKLGLSEIIDSGTAAPLGKLMGVDATISGRIKKVEEKDKRASLEAYLKMVNVETGKVIWAGVVEGHSTTAPETEEEIYDSKLGLESIDVEERHQVWPLQK